MIDDVILKKDCANCTQTHTKEQVKKAFKAARYIFILTFNSFNVLGHIRLDTIRKVHYHGKVFIRH